jgi:hypothetical protein
MGDTFVGVYNSVADQSCDATIKSIKSAKVVVEMDDTAVSSHDAFDGRGLQQQQKAVVNSSSALL